MPEAKFFNADDDLAINFSQSQPEREEEVIILLTVPELHPNHYFSIKVFWSSGLSDDVNNNFKFCSFK